MMDDYVKQDSIVSYHGALRTLRFTTASHLPYSLTDQVLNKSFQNRIDSSVDPPRFIYGFGLYDDAMRDVIRENRFGRFSRFTDHSVQYVGTLHLSDDYYTYMYSTSSDFPANEMMEEVIVNDDGSEVEKSKEVRKPESYDSPNEIYLVTIDKYGKKIAEQQIGCRCSPLHISLSSVDKNGLIEIRDMEQKWAKDPLVAGYKDNKIVSRTVTATRRYTIKSDGTITAIAETTTARTQ